MTCGVYLIRNVWNGRGYVGSSVNIEDRWKTHICRLNNAKHPAGKLVNAWRKYGPSAFEFRILEVTSKAALLEREQYWIDTTSAHVLGYNTRPDARSCKGYKRGVPSAEHKKKNAEAHTGAKNPNFGKPRSEETRRKISEAQKGKPRKPVSDETRAKKAQSMKQRWEEDPNREERVAHLLSVVTRGKGSRRPHSEETKQKMREAHRRRRESKGQSRDVHKA